MTLTYREFPDTRVAELRVAGRATKDDYDAVIEPLQAFIDTHGPIRVLEVIDSYTGFDPAILLPGIKFDILNIRHVSHVAVVSDIGWISPLARAAGALLSCRLRTFDLADRDAAMDWLSNAD